MGWSVGDLRAADKLKRKQQLSFLNRRASLVFQHGECFERKNFAPGALYVHTLFDARSAQSRGADTLCRNAESRHQVAVRQ